MTLYIYKWKLLGEENSTQRFPKIVFSCGPKFWNQSPFNCGPKFWKERINGTDKLDSREFDVIILYQASIL
jgi:hypothetical protein